MSFFKNSKTQAEEKAAADVEVFKQGLEQAIKEDIAFQAAQFAKDYQDLLPQIKKQYEEGVDKHLQSLKDQIDMLTQEATKSIKNQLEITQADLKQQVDRELRSVSDEVKIYKSQKMTQIEGQVKQIVQDAVYQIIGKVISPAEHDELIRQAVTKASREIHL